MLELLREETERLARCWDQHAPAWLGAYLIAGVEDPRLNLQSILSRHFLIRHGCPESLGALMTEEYRFSACLNWLMKLVRRATEREECDAILHALRKGADNAEGMEIPLFVVQTYAELPIHADGVTIPNYLESFLALAPEGQGGAIESVLNTFQLLWRNSLAPRWPAKPDAGIPVSTPTLTRASLIEPACGSANDYRFLHAYGIAEGFDYAGFDLCPKNIENAQALFPEIRFQVGNVFEIQADDKTYDFCLVHDLLEHLSMDGMHAAVHEICRVTRRGILIGFFQMEEIRDHLVRPVDEYHWNLLSMKKMRDLFGEHGFTGQVVHIGTFLNQQVRCDETHNPNAYTFLLHASETAESDLCAHRASAVHRE